ncbi:MAG TPA: thiopeptide-type bacteriocin biosynthesis protein [Micromonosporaceae bacterium]
MGVKTDPATEETRTGWRSLHCFVHWRPEHVDAFLTGTVAPLMDGLREAGHLRDWFFIRYSEGGPHLRIRARDADTATVRKLREALVEAVRTSAYPLWSLPESGAVRHEHGEVCELPYEPETERYGGPEALPVAEDVFCESSRIAIAVVARTAGRAQRLVAAADLVLATAIALDLDRLDTVRWLRRAAIAWRWHRDSTTLAPPMVQNAALSAATGQAAALVRRWDEIAASAGTGRRLRDRWAQQVRTARARLEPDSRVSRERWLQVWSSQLHMLLNRIGVLPDEERSLYWFIAASLLAPQGPTDFFADHTEAVDRRYLEASNFARSRIEWQQPRKAPRAARTPYRLSARPPVALPSAPPIGGSLAEALTGRASGRGDLGGSVNAADLAALLWSGYAGAAVPDSDGPPRRPYPSAGASYVTRLRLVVWSVDGLAPGQYEVDETNRTLLPLGAAPSPDEMVAASMWFSMRGSADAGYERIDVSTLPALLGLYVDLGTLRKTYGLRALRFGLLEAGHLAQNLALCAAATDLALGMVGGFYDDVAHELLLLDGVDEVLAYLLPVGRRKTT